MKYVTVQYFKPESDAYIGRAYTYRTELPLQEGDLVIAPTYKGESKARVFEAEVPASRVDPAWADKVREITQYQEDGAEQNG